MRALTLAALPPCGPVGFIGSIVADGDRVIAVGGTYNQPTMLCSEDRGRTFAAIAPPPLVPGLRDVHVQGDTIWIVGEMGGVHRTRNLGKTWHGIWPMGEACLYSVMPGVDRRIWILGDSGGIRRARHSNPNVKTFDTIANLSTARLLYMFVDGKTTWILDSAGMLQRSVGKDFVEVPLKAMRTPRPLCALDRTRKGTLILLGDGGLILRSTNDGASWKKIPVDSRNNFEKLLVTRYGIFVVGARGSLLVSHDDGVSFQGLDTNVDAHLWSLIEIDGELLIGGEHGRLWRIDRAELADLLCFAYTKRDPVLSDLAARLRDGDEGADLVLEDALKERELL